MITSKARFDYIDYDELTINFNTVLYDIPTNISIPLSKFLLFVYVMKRKNNVGAKLNVLIEMFYDNSSRQSKMKANISYNKHNMNFFIELHESEDNIKNPNGLIMLNCYMVSLDTFCNDIIHILNKEYDLRVYRVSSHSISDSDEEVNLIYRKEIKMVIDKSSKSILDEILKTNYNNKCYRIKRIKEL